MRDKVALTHSSLYVVMGIMTVRVENVINVDASENK